MNETTSNIDKIREAIWTVFGTGYMISRCDSAELTEVLNAEYGGVDTTVNLDATKSKYKAMMFKDIMLPPDDKGQWAPEAEAVVHCENGIDAGYYDASVQDDWMRVSKLVGDVICEMVNPGVMAIYKD